jgi:hypothetical protein
MDKRKYSFDFIAIFSVQIICSMSETLSDDLSPAGKMIAVGYAGAHNIVVPPCFINVFEDAYFHFELLGFSDL